MGYEYEVFISYNNDNPPRRWILNHFVDMFQDELSYQITESEIFIDKRDLKGGYAWEPSLVSALSRSRILIPIFTAKFFREDCWALNELAYMYTRHIKYSNNSNIYPIMPIILSGDLEDYECSIQYYDFRMTRGLPIIKKPSIENKLYENIKTLVKDLKENRKKLPNWISEFENEDLFNSSKIYVQTVRSFFKQSDKFSDFSNPNQI